MPEDENSLILDFGQKEPSKVPGPAAAGVVEYPCLGILQELVAERILPGEAAELVQKVVRAHVVAPGVGYLMDELGRKVGERREDTLDSAELSESVYSAASQSLSHLVDLRDGDHLAGAGLVGIVGAGVARHFVCFCGDFNEVLVEVVGLAFEDWVKIMGL